MTKGVASRLSYLGFGFCVTILLILAVVYGFGLNEAGLTDAPPLRDQFAD